MAQTRRRKTRSSARAAAAQQREAEENASSQSATETQSQAEESQDEQSTQQQEASSDTVIGDSQEVEKIENENQPEAEEMTKEITEQPQSPDIEQPPLSAIEKVEIVSEDVSQLQETNDTTPDKEAEPETEVTGEEYSTQENNVLQPEYEKPDKQLQTFSHSEDRELVNEPPQDVDMVMDSPEVIEMDESDSKQDIDFQQGVTETLIEEQSIEPQEIPIDDINEEETVNVDQEQKGSQKSKKKKKRRRKRAKAEQRQAEVAPTNEDDSGVEVEYVSEIIDLPKWDPSYAAFHKIFETFKLEEKPIMKTEEPVERRSTVEAVTQEKEDDDDDDDDDEDLEKEKKEEPEKLSKKQLKKQSRMAIATLKQMVTRPDVVEMHDVNSKDPQLLVYLKAYKNTVPVPRHWCFKRKYLAGKRGFVKPPFELPDFIKQTGIMEMRAAMQEKEDSKSLKTKQRGKIRPKLGKIDIDYQKLHDAFFKFQTKPKMTIHGDLYYEGKEFEIRLKEKKPGDLSDDLRTALGMPVGPGKNLIPPPWLIAMQRYGPPPSYPNLKIPGLNAPIPEGASFGYHAGGWGKPPVDEMGKPLYGDVFGISSEDMPQMNEEESVDKTPWGALESESESEEESEEEEDEEDQTGLVTPGDAGLVTPSGISSVGAGLETPDMIELRKRKEIEDAMETGGDTPALYTVLAEKRTTVGASMMGSQHTYDLAPPKKASDGVEITLDPSELELEPAAMAAKYDDTMKEREANIHREDFSDMVAEHAAKKKRKKPTDSGKAAKKYKEFKF